MDDTKIIKSKYLINNIEHSFDVWNNQKWAQHLSFDEFCELILPYKVFEGQVLDNWKEFFYKRYNKLLSNLKYASIYSRSSYIACETINKVLHSEIKSRINFTAHNPILRLKTLLSIPSGTCDEYTLLTAAIMKANGIPVGVDFTPQWPFRSIGHTWNFLYDNTKNNIPFEGISKTIGVYQKKDHIMGKVFRYTYKINREVEELIKQGEPMPQVFSSPLIEDVTKEHLSTIDIERKVNTKDKNVYMAVFNNKEWEILAWGINKDGRALFKDIGKDILYLPVTYTNAGIEPVGNPFIVTLNNRIRELKPDTSTKQTLRLHRKYPLLGHAFTMNMRKVGSKIQASNYEDFRDSSTFYIFTDLEKVVDINPQQKKYRYWRALSSSIGHSTIAELAFFDKGNAHLIGKIIGTDGSYRNGKHEKEAVFDGDIMTYFDAPFRSGCWVGMDFKDSVAVSRITCVMRGDGNDIQIGNEYELSYWANGRWASLGKKIAKDVFLEYKNCPVGALFLLHNRTKGKEERIFTYENGKQVWW